MMKELGTSSTIFKPKILSNFGCVL